MQLPREVRTQILKYLLYSPEPLRKESFDSQTDESRNEIYVDPTFKFYPSILGVCRQLYLEGGNILYFQNIATATVTVWGSSDCVPFRYLDGVISEYSEKILRRFTRWDILVRVQFEDLETEIDTISKFVTETLSKIPNLTRLWVRLLIWGPQDELESDDAYPFHFDNPRDLDDIAEQIFRPFSILRVKQAEFTDDEGKPLYSTLPLSRLMMSDHPSSVTLYKLISDLRYFLVDSLSETSLKILNPRLALLRIARDQYDVPAFRFALRSILTYLISFRGLTPPSHLVAYVQDSTPAEIEWKKDVERLRQLHTVEYSKMRTS